MKTIEEFKICNDCKHVSCIRGDILTSRKCNHKKALKNINIVSGVKEYESCSSMRRNNKCGKKAKLYEQS